MNPEPRPRLDAPALPFPEDAPVLDEPVHAEAPSEGRRGEGQPWDHCPNCGAALVNDRCKRRCTRCHYFMSCADFD